MDLCCDINDFICNYLLLFSLLNYRIYKYNDFKIIIIENLTYPNL